MRHYMQSKVGNVYLAHETAKRLGREGILSLVSTHSLFTFLDDYYDGGDDGVVLIWDIIVWIQSVNPGALSSDLQRHSSAVQRSVMVCPFLSP